MSKRRGSILGAILWMAFLSLILCWLPLFGSLIAGLVGGNKAGSAGRGFIACLIPAAITSFAVLLIFWPALPGLLMGLIGGSMTVLLLLINFPLVCGAIVGGALER